MKRWDRCGGCFATPLPSPSSPNYPFLPRPMSTPCNYIFLHFTPSPCNVILLNYIYPLQCTRPQRWSIFQGDGMVNVFFRPPLPSMVFQWFWQSWTITIECFFGGPTIGTNGFSMVFKILRAMVYNGFEVSDGLVAFLWISCSSSLIGGTNDCLTCADGIGVAGR